MGRLIFLAEVSFGFISPYLFVCRYFMVLVLKSISLYAFETACKIKIKNGFYSQLYRNSLIPISFVTEIEIR